MFIFFLFSFTDSGSSTEGKREGGRGGKKRKKNKARKNYGAVPVLVLVPYLSSLGTVLDTQSAAGLALPHGGGIISYSATSDFASV